MDSSQILVDTNILLYLYYDNPDIKKAALEKIQSVKDDGLEPVITEQAFREFIVVLTNIQKIKKKIDFEQLQTDANYILQNFPIVYPSSQSISFLSEFTIKYEFQGKRIHDVNLVAVAKANNISKILTNNVSDFLFALSEGFEIITL
jgi:predicted nucleic acid-binding protein